MTPSDWVALGISIFTALGAGFAWLRNQRWMEEYKAAKEAQIQALQAQGETLSKTKDEVIRAKEAQLDVLRAQVQTLQELTPMKVREYFESVKVQLEEYNDVLQQQLRDKEEEISQLQSLGQQSTPKVTILQEQKVTIAEKINDVYRASSRLSFALQRPATMEELATALGIGPKDVEQLMQIDELIDLRQQAERKRRTPSTRRTSAPTDQP